jgi:hypothetical protein
MNGVQGQNSKVILLSLWCSLCHLYAVKSEYKQCTLATGGVNRSYSEKTNDHKSAIGQARLNAVRRQRSIHICLWV